MTLRGEKPPAKTRPPLAVWTEQYAVLADALITAADQNGLDQARRKQMKLRLDGRQMSLETAITTLRFHARQEYPSLLRSGVNPHVLNTFQATNMNDRYWLGRMQALPEMQAAALQAAIISLDSHLAALPTDAEPGK